MRRRPSPIVLAQDQCVCEEVRAEEPVSKYDEKHMEYFEKHIAPIIKHRTPRGASSAVEIVSGIWLGAASDAMDIEKLGEQGITGIINCAEKDTITNTEYYPQAWDYIGLPCDDDPRCDIIGSHLDAFVDFVDMCAVKEKKVLVHCVAGINRSATLLVGYLVKSRGMSLKDAIALCFAKRPIILSNQAFVMSLVERFAV